MHLHNAPNWQQPATSRPRHAFADSLRSLRAARSLAEARPAGRHVTIAAASSHTALLLPGVAFLVRVAAMTNVTATAGDMGSSGGGTPPALPLVVFCTAAVAAMSLIIRPLPVPTGRGRTLKLHYSVPVALGVAVLLLSGSASLRDLVNGMRGDEHVKPLQVLAIFYSMAYLCVALDLTGLFAAIALAITNRMPEGRLGPFLTYFVMCSVMTLFTSNDVVILTFTPIIVYFARATATDPMPLLYTQFYVANTWSALFYIGNPTNVIVAQAYKLGFFQYTSVTALPTLVAGLLTLLLLLLAFYPPRCLSTRLRWCRRRSTSSAPEASPQPAARPYEPGVRVAGTLALDNVAASAPPADRQSPPQQRQAQAASAEAVDNDEAAGKHNSDVTRVWYGRTGHHESNARAALVHPLLAALGSVVLLACLAMLAAADAIGWAPWLITSLCAAAMLLLNIVLQPWLPPSARAHIDCCDARCKGRRSPGTALRQGFLDEDGAALSLPSTPAARRASGHAAARSAAARDGAVDASADEEAGEGAAAVEAAGPAGGGAKNQAAEEEASGEPSSSGEQAAAATVTVWTALWRLPWSLLPFVAGMFILTSILKVRPARGLASPPLARMLMHTRRRTGLWLDSEPGTALGGRHRRQCVRRHHAGWLPLAPARQHDQQPAHDHPGHPPPAGHVRAC